MNKKSFYHMKMNAISHVCMVAGLCHFVFSLFRLWLLGAKRQKMAGKETKNID